MQGRSNHLPGAARCLLLEGRRLVWGGWSDAMQPRAGSLLAGEADMPLPEPKYTAGHLKIDVSFDDPRIQEADIKNSEVQEDEKEEANNT